VVFSSVTFLFFFLPLVIGAYAIAPRRARNGVLVAASFAFYTWGTGWLVVALAVSIAVNYLLGHAVERRVLAGDRRGAMLPLAAAVLLNIGLLGWFKYANFAVDQVNGVIGAFGALPLDWADVILPIGISFYTFHSLSYLIDLFRGTASHLESPIDFALYITFFPQLVAGPIVRFHEIREQIVHRQESSTEFALGAIRFCHGLGKKVLIADMVAPIANAAFSVPPASLNAKTAALGVIAYTVQLYFDFSGYSDMALGLGRMFGFHLPENFDRPYAARSITEFWRRWHMSLSRWFRDYLYVPLGGNRGTAAATYRNLVIVFLVTGLWHGANWTFVVWGAYHGLLLLVERRLGIGRGREERFAWLARARTVSLVMFGWILFRSPDIGSAVAYVTAFADLSGPLVGDVSIAFSLLARLALVAGVASFLLPGTWVTGRRLVDDARPALGGLRLVQVAVVMPAAIVALLAGTFHPFLYFNF
jgi:alginate O-acetyltransferase complex protein AlgI